MSAVTDEMVTAALPSYSEGGCSGLDEQERREVVRDILEAALALLPAQTEPDAGRVEAMRLALVEAEEVLAMSEHTPFADPVHHEEVKDLGRRIGFGALMSTAERAWREEAERKGYPVGGEFVSGPCRSTLTLLLAQIRSALPTPPSPPREEIEHQGVVAVGVKG